MSQNNRFRQYRVWLLIAYPFITYTIALSSILINPTWYDNSPEANLISWPERFLTAAFLGVWLMILGLPLLAGTLFLLARLAKR